jgi:hypothetical protein
MATELVDVVGDTLKRWPDHQPIEYPQHFEIEFGANTELLILPGTRAEV